MMSESRVRIHTHTRSRSKASRSKGVGDFGDFGVVTFSPVFALRALVFVFVISPGVLFLLKRRGAMAEALEEQVLALQQQLEAFPCGKSACS